MQIKLLMDDGKQKTFTVPFIKARMLRRAIELGEQLGEVVNSKTVSLDDIDAMVDFVVELFNSQFSADALWDGLTTDEFVPELSRCINECMGNNKKADPNARTRGR